MIVHPKVISTQALLFLVDLRAFRRFIRLA